MLALKSGGLELGLDTTVPAAMEGAGAVGSSVRARALARLAARAAAAEASGVEASPVLALEAPASVPDETCGAGTSTLPLSIGIRTIDGVCERLLERGVAIPAKASRLFTTNRDDQPLAHIELYLGERLFCSGNRLLGSFRLAPLPVPSYRSFVQLEVSVTVETCGSVVCEAMEVEGRALGGEYARGAWQGSMLCADGQQARPALDDGQGEIALFSHALVKHLPVLLATRTVRLPSGRDIVIRQHQRREEERVGTGGVLWEAAIVLADYVGRGREALAWPGKRVLELGAGTGLAAIALALEGAEVCATDGNPRVLECARRNVEAAGPLPGKLRLEVFDWNSDEDLHRMQAAGPWDTILGSDLVYPGNAGKHCVASNHARPPADETLLSLLGRLAGPETEVVLALKDRTGEVARFVRLVESREGEWELTRAPPEALMPAFRTVPALAVLHLRRRRLAGAGART